MARDSHHTAVVALLEIAAAEVLQAELPWSEPACKLVPAK
jgi:hypothetical protein